jgi:L-iditol 2-dehydrogenase
MGAEKVILCDIQQSRLDLVKELIPNINVFNTIKLSVDDIVMEIKSLLNDDDGYADCAIDCCGVESAVQSSIHLTRSGGVVYLVGMGCCDKNLPILKATCREVEIKGVFRYRNTHKKCIELISTGKIDIKRLITHRFQFNQGSIMDAFESCNRGTGSLHTIVE